MVVSCDVESSLIQIFTLIFPVVGHFPSAMPLLIHSNLIVLASCQEPSILGFDLWSLSFKTIIFFIFFTSLVFWFVLKIQLSLQVYPPGQYLKENSHLRNRMMRNSHLFRRIEE